MTLDCASLRIQDMTGRGKNAKFPKHCLPFRNISGDVVEGVVELIDGKTPFNH
jgi:hypothetical protein